MNLDRTRLPMPPRRVSWFVLFGVVLLIASVLGARESFQTPKNNNSDTSSIDADLPIGGFGHVDVEGGVTHMYPLVVGRVVKVMVHEGDVVDEGVELFKIDDTAARIKLEEAKIAVEGAKSQVRKAEDAAKKKQASHMAQRTAQEKRIKAKKSQVKIAEEEVKEAKRRLKSGNIGEEKLRQAEAAVTAAQAGVEAEEAFLDTLVLEDVQIPVDEARIFLRAQQQLVAMAEYNLRECAVRAPAKGEVLRILVAVGDPLSAAPQKPAVEFAIGKRIIRAEIDQEFAADVHLEQVAEIQDDTRSTVPVWSGKVKRISDWYAPPRSVIQEPLHFNDVRTKEVIIDDLGGDTARLAIGQRVRVMLK